MEYQLPAVENVGENGAGSDSKTIKNVEAPILPEGSSWERRMI